MAKIKESDIFEGRIFQQQAEDAEKFVITLKALEKTSKDLKGKLQLADPQSSKEIQELRENVEKLRLSNQLFTETKKAETAARKEAEKQAKEEAKASKQELDSYQNKSKQLNDLRKRYKALAVEQGLSSKETKELAKEVAKLDKELKDIDASAGQFQRNVGNYPKVTENAKKGFSSLSGFLLGVVVGAFAKSRAESRQLQGVIERLTNAVNIFAQAIFKTFTEVIIPTFQEWNLRLQAGKQLLKGNFDEAEKLDKKADELSKTTKSLTDVWGGLTDVLKESDDLTVKRLELTDRLIDQSVLLEASIEKLRGQEEAVAVAIGDATTSFDDQVIAIREVLKIQGERISQELQLAKLQRDIALLAAENELVNKQFFKNLSEAQKEDLRQKLRTLEFVKDKNIADAVSIETLEALKTSTIAVTQAENERTKFEKEQAKELRQIQQDRFEQQLDILLDGFDNQKTINERIIAAEKKVFDERRRVLERTKKLNEQNKKDQEKLFIEQTGLQIDLNDLVNTDDQKLLEKKLFNLGKLSEIERQRLLEVIRDQRTANQDLIDAENDLNDAILASRERRAESIKAIQDLENEFAIQQNDRRFEKELEQQEQAIFFKTKQLKELAKLNEGENILLLEREKSFAISEANKIVDADERAAKLLEIEAEYQRKFFDLNQETADKIAEINERKRIKDIEFIEKTINQISEILDRTLSDSFAKNIDAIDDELDRISARIDKQREQAEKGNADFNAFLLRQEKEAQLERERLAKKEEQLNKAIALSEAFFQSYISELKKPGSDSNKALLAASSSTAKALALETVITGLASFKEGTEDTGTVAQPLDKDGGRLAILHDKERVVPKSENMELLKMGIRNEDLVPLVKAGIAAPQFSAFNSTLIVQKLDSLENTIKNKREFVDKTDKHGNYERTLVENGMLRTVKYVKAKPRI
jgi:hypothetical protein